MSLTKRSVVVGGHRTSVSLEPAFWEALARMAARRAVSVNMLVTEIDRDRATPGDQSEAADPKTTGLSSAIRVAVLEWAMAERSGLSS
jgi:predicted DNA-binding ribbon-helix-helix protein